jgi:hypothetical protein
MPITRRRALQILPSAVLLAARSRNAVAQPVRPADASRLEAWYAHGQTWLVWKTTDVTADQGSDVPLTWRIYASDRPFETLADATLVGRLFPEDWRPVRIAALFPEAVYSVPDARGGMRALAGGEALFVYTPHDTRPKWFAVVRDGDDAIRPAHRIGPIEQMLEPVQAHLQFTGANPTPGNTQTFRMYAHWIDGRADWRGGRADYPVMGNAHFNGTPRLFWVWEPIDGPVKAESPLVVALRGGDGYMLDFRPGYQAGTNSYIAGMGLALQGALMLVPDQGHLVWQPNQDGSGFGARFLLTWWYGYWEGYDRFRPPASPENAMRARRDPLLVGYTQRQLEWTVEWVTRHERVDPARVSIAGHSTGSQGTGIAIRLHPERYAAALSLQPGLETPSSFVFGPDRQPMPVDVPGLRSAEEIWNESVALNSAVRDLPVSTIVIGKGDVNPWAGFRARKAEAFTRMSMESHGRRLWWDERAHGSWAGAHFQSAPALRLQALTRHRRDRSYPAFFAVDQDLSAGGRQPSIGNGDPADGDPFGTYGG